MTRHLTVAEKAGVLMHGILRNHPFADGNKRTAWISVQVFLELNGARIVGVGQLEAADAVCEAVVDRWSPADITHWLSARMVETPFTDGPLS
ncbi:type II toxin-antitoxin system death-on-curing family toxin [Citricoccus sp. NPDC055426]|uniref:type II toxin-antitoxin system death-on-curing family toxin n=1 Tax=Citricoccus sp. NPDC055426 TaxID=3155536 RepID=UPI00341B7719